ncbi:hypothetical protein GF412_05815 [Candidatus Micrarchaeota archaeon]|nr:hypothetical protein [Candidatus Micrarchaeota archaeon]
MRVISLSLVFLPIFVAKSLANRSSLQSLVLVVPVSSSPVQIERTLARWSCQRFFSAFFEKAIAKILSQVYTLSIGYRASEEEAPVHEIITLRHDDTSIAFDTTAATWSLTDLWRAAGSPENREPWNWARKEGKRYLETLATTLHVTWSPENLSHSQVFAPEDHDGPEEHTAHTHVERDSHVTWSPENLCATQVLAPEDHVSSGESQLFETRRGRGGGTWGHQLVGLEYARYLSPALSIACNQFLLDYWRGAHQPPDPRVAALEQRVAALEQARQPAQETLTITVSLDPSERINVMRDLGGIVTPSQLFAELRRRGQAATSTGIRQWLHRAAKRGELRRRHRGQYEVSDTDTPPANKEH